jgi:hypothetical protein
MDIGSIFLILGLLVLVALFISRPFFEHTSRVVSQDEHETSALMAERDRLINALQELDFDYALGKIPEADYPAQRALLLQQGAEILKKLDVHQLQPAGDDVEARIEAAIAARRADAARVDVQGQPRLAPNGAANRNIATPDDDIEAILASRRRERSEKSAGFCPRCGRPVQISDRFCPKCGATLA